MTSDTATIEELDSETETTSKLLPPYNVILMNDDDHTVDYVVRMMKKIFGYPDEKGVKIAVKVHEEGRCIVWTGPKEVAELKQEQIHAFGADKLIAHCKGAMTCVIEPSV